MDNKKWEKIIKKVFNKVNCWVLFVKEKMLTKTIHAKHGY